MRVLYAELAIVNQGNTTNTKYYMYFREHIGHFTVASNVPHSCVRSNLQKVLWMYI